MLRNDSWRRCPEPPLDPPEDLPECQECDAPLKTVRPDYAECSECGWVNEVDYSMEHYDG